MRGAGAVDKKLQKADCGLPTKQLPNGWCVSSLDEIVNSIGLFIDGDWVESKDQDLNGKIRLLQLADIGDGYFIDKSSRFINEDAFKRLNCTYVLPGDILLARMPNPLGRACILPTISYKAITVVDVCIIRLNQKYINNSWLMFFINSFEFRNRIEQLSSGTTRKRISRKNLSTISLPLPPLNEQQRIVAKLDAIMPRIEAVKERLDKVPTILKRFRQSVLTAAVTGKLTEQWREENKNTEEVDGILKALIKKRIIDFNLQLLNSKKNKLSKPPKPNYLEYSFETDTEKNSELPTTWIVSKVGLLCDCIVPGRDKPKSFTGSIPWVTLPEINSNELNSQSGKLKLSDSEINEVNARVIPSGSVVMCCVGNFGISALVNDPIVINQQLHAFIKSKIILSKYLMYHLKILKEYQQSIATSTTIAYLNKTNCNSLPINLPPLEEQKEIVRQVDKLFALADKVEVHYQKAKARVDKLSQSVLAKAFRGELVPQDPNDEPAEKLLERILEEKKKMEAELKGVRKKTSRRKTGEKAGSEK